MELDIVSKYVNKICKILKIDSKNETIYTANRKLRLTRKIEDYPTLEWVLRCLYNEGFSDSDKVEFLEDMFERCFPN